MEQAILFKILQRRYKFRNPNSVTELPADFVYTKDEYVSAKDYILNLARYQICYCYPTHPGFPRAMLRMKEPPLFFEYIGEPVWLQTDFLSVVGSREISELTESWMKTHLPPFLKDLQVGVVSGGARGVDQLAHQIAIKTDVPTIIVLPSGLLNLYPANLEHFRRQMSGSRICFFSEFEIDQKLHKSHFFFRNRSIAAFGKLTLVTQASIKSGSLLTVHHCLEIGRQVLTIPAHPELIGFSGNLKLLHEGAFSITGFEDLHNFWMAESWSN